jgi:hypothetical protein
VSFEVAGYPPAKNEALSIFGKGHSYASWGTLLLATAQRASAEQGFPASTRHRSDSMLSYSRLPARTPADATNYLGGIGNVLEHKSHRGTLDHLGDLAAVWLYRNDRRIKAVTYRETEADRVSYMVTVKEL